MNPSPGSDATYLACLTPPGTAAIAALAVRGPRSWGMVRDLFLPVSGRPLPDEPEPGRFWTGRFGDEAAGGRDEVVVAARRGGRWVEIHCHGGREVVRALMEALAIRGAEICSWEELERWTADDGVRASALAALARATTVRTAAILLDQHQGVLAAALGTILSALERGDVGEAGQLLDELASRISLGRHLTRPWRVVVTGAPNVGKSSLVNALAGYQRSVVAPTPGTTRDVVTTTVALDGWPVELADTAGWRDEAETLERQGIDLARAAAAAADLCLWVVDASAAPVWPADLAVPVLHAINKTDLPAVWDLAQATNAVRVSARTGAGLADLCAAIAGRLVPAPPPAGAAVPFTDVLCARVEETRAACARGDARGARQALEAALGDPG